MAIGLPVTIMGGSFECFAEAVFPASGVDWPRSVLPVLSYAPGILLHLFVFCCDRRLKEQIRCFLWTCNSEKKLILGEV